MKEPKRFDRPRMYYQESIGGGYIIGDRIRIIYPNGKVEWATLTEPRFKHFLTYFFDTPACWYRETDCVNGPSSLQKMKEYDKNRGFPEAEFLGEL